MCCPLVSRGLVALVFVAGVAALVTAQPPAKPPVPAPLPPVNPAVAKLDFSLAGLDGPGFSIAAGDADLQLIAVGGETGGIQVWKRDTLPAAREGKAKPDVWKGHQGPVVALAYAGGPTLVSAGADRKVIFWKVPEGKPIATGASAVAPRALAMTGDGKTLASAGEGDAIQLWDVKTGASTAKLQEKGDWILCLAFSVDGKQLVSGANDGTLKLWDVAAAKKVRDLPAPPTPAPKPPLPDPVPATSVAFAPDGKSVVVGTADGPIHTVNLADGKIIRTQTGHTSAVTGLAFHPSGTLLLSSSKDRTVKLWNPANPQPVKNLEGHNAWVEGIALFNQSTQAVTVSADQTVKVWDLAEPKKK